MQPTRDTPSQAVALGDGDRSDTGPGVSGVADGWRFFLKSGGGVKVKPNRGADVAPVIAVTLGELKRISRAAAPETPSLGDGPLRRRRGRGKTMMPLRILVVEDDLMVGPLLAEMLEELGHIVCAVEVDAVNAVAAATRYHPDLMIVDVGLGEASGIAAVREILKQGFVPHVFVTGDVLSGLSLGPDTVLIQKPYRESDLIAAIARAIGGRGS